MIKCYNCKDEIKEEEIVWDLYLNDIEGPYNLCSFCQAYFYNIFMFRILEEDGFKITLVRHKHDLS